MDNKLFFIDNTDPEFTIMFGNFADPVMRNEEYLESLQYMGTVVEPSGRIRHQFRHRAVPVTNERKYWEIIPSVSFCDKVKAGEYDDKFF
jgi:hypothetical protein